MRLPLEARRAGRVAPGPAAFSPCRGHASMARAPRGAATEAEGRPAARRPPWDVHVLVALQPQSSAQEPQPRYALVVGWPLLPIMAMFTCFRYSPAGTGRAERGWEGAPGHARVPACIPGMGCPQGPGAPSPLLQDVHPGSPWVVVGTQLQESLQRSVWAHLAGSENGQSQVEQRL